MKRGFSLVELMVAMSIFLIIFMIIFGTYATLQKLCRGGFTQVAFQSIGRTSLSKISRNMYSATSAVILDSGNRVRFITDPNRTSETDSDDVTGEYYVSGTNIVYDPNISNASDEVVLLRNVIRESNIPFFQADGDLIVVTFKIFNSDTVYGSHWASFTTSVKMRNS